MEAHLAQPRRCAPFQRILGNQRETWHLVDGCVGLLLWRRAYVTARRLDLSRPHIIGVLMQYCTAAFEVHADTSHVYDQQAPDPLCLTTQSLLNLSNCSDHICKVVTIFVLCHV